MAKPIKRYYDTNALLYFYSKEYQQKYPELFPDRSNIAYENYACAFTVEEAIHAFMKQSNGQIDIGLINKYLHNYTILKHNYFEAYQLYIRLFVELYEKGLVRTRKKRPGDDPAIDSKDIFVFSMAFINEMDEFVTFDSDFKILEDYMKKSPYLAGRKMKIIIEKAV